ncbi:MAG: PAS domain-containing sensor histidine kinase [Verrucomicrobia bacterium]|nr:PAS domain-containing sensor histidine kinase [Verrucomicrobiota bacterium]
MSDRSKSRRRPRELTFESRIFFLALLTGLPATILALGLLWFGGFDTKTKWTVTVLVLLFWLCCAYAVREKVRFPLQTLSNLLAAIREGDYSIRARGARHDDALGEALAELNLLGENLREQRLGALEATALLSKVMAEIEVAVFTFDGAQKLRLLNRSGERLLAQPSERLLGRNAADLGLAECLQGEPARTIQMTFPGGMGRYGVRRSTFREGGVPHQLLVLTDLSRTLREEERQAWQRLLRVLGHELNNSLAPIKSIAASIESLLAREPKPPDWKEDMQQGLAVISARTAALNRFMDAYTRVARLPQPRLQPVEVSGCVQRVAGLETRLKVNVEPGPPLKLPADGDQLDQLLINLLRNAADAAVETGGGVKMGWRKLGAQVEIWVEDEGPGLPNTTNLFVPFFTTKPKGSGIGLVLCRQIAEAHGGTLTLENSPKRAGCIARLRLPL